MAMLSPDLVLVSGFSQSIRPAAQSLPGRFIRGNPLKRNELEPKLKQLKWNDATSSKLPLLWALVWLLPTFLRD